MGPRSREGRSFGRFLVPVGLILGLLAAHWVVADWGALTRLISSTLAAIG